MNPNREDTIVTTPFHTEDQTLDAEIARVHTHLSNISPDDEQYQRTVDQLTKLYKLRNDQSKLNLELHQTTIKAAQEANQANREFALKESQVELENEQKAAPFWKRVDPSVVLTVAGNLAVALVVVKYEQTGVISSKVTGFMKKI